MCLDQRYAAWLVGLVITLGMASADLKRVEGCLAEAVSIDYLVADCPLIVIGKVQAVVQDNRPGAVARSGGIAFSGSRPDKRATIARVRVLRVLKGRYSKSDVLLGSGPVASCNPSGSFHEFVSGQESVFLLPKMPDDGPVSLTYGGQVLPLDETEVVEHHIARARAYRERFIEDAKRESLEKFEAAFTLWKRLDEDSRTWPEGRSDAPESPEAIAVKKNCEELAATEIEVIRTAMALDWQNAAARAWSRHSLWWLVCQELYRTRAKEIVAAQRAWIRRELDRVGVVKDDIDHYLEGLGDDDFDRTLSFPPEAPSAYCKRIEREITTDFILRYHIYDRGDMFRSYGMHSDVLKMLDLTRVKRLLPALRGSDDPRLRRVGEWAGSAANDVELISKVVDEVGRNAEAWKKLVSSDDKQTQRRMKAFVTEAVDSLDSDQLVVFWRQLKQGRSFHAACAAQSREFMKRQEKEADRITAIIGHRADTQLLAALRDYLDAAASARERQSDRGSD